MNTFIISMGSNENKTENMFRCRDLLGRCYPNVLFSDMIRTEPIGANYSTAFYNQLTLVQSEDSVSLLTNKLKRIEQEIGRQPGEKAKGIIKIDLDLLVVNGSIVKSKDFERSYIYVLLDDLKEKTGIDLF